MKLIDKLLRLDELRISLEATEKAGIELAKENAELRIENATLRCELDRLKCEGRAY